MIGTALIRKYSVGVASVWAAAAGVALAGTPAERFYEGYYLETVDRDYGAAAEAYGKVVADRSADEGLKAKAQARLDGVREELACSDFARLMPVTSLAYFEIKDPANQLLRLVEQLGLLGKTGERPAEPGKTVAISPALIREALGIRGAALAITAIDPMKQKPAGVLVFHPGDMAIMRGLIETGLPFSSPPAEPVLGFPTYNIEGEVFVTLTSRLIVVSPQRAQIEGVLRRLSGQEPTSLLTNEDLVEALKGRDDSLLFFCVNAKPVLPMLNAMLGAGAMQSRELALAQALLDINSFHSFVGRAGVSDDGMSFTLTMRLNESHRNLVYNLMRTPPIDEETLKGIPRGVAGFVAGALNQRDFREAPSGPSAGSLPIVTALDIGRELFANVTSFAFYALPPDGSGANESSRPIPDLGAIISVIEPARSEALWTQVLGIAAIASGSRSLEGSIVDIGGVRVRTYQLPQGVTLYYATHGNDVLVSTTAAVMAASIRARTRGESVLSDPAFIRSLERVGPSTTRAVFVHPGRVLSVAERFIPPDDLEKIEAFRPSLAETVASAVVDQSAGTFRVSAMVTGIPDIAALVTQAIEREQQQRQAHTRLAQAMSGGRWSEALAMIDDLAGKGGGKTDLLRKKFYVLAVGMKDRESALACGQEVFEAMHGDAQSLNNLAWGLLTESEYEGAYNDLALRISERSNDLSGHNNWAYLDTLALACFETGNPARAVELENKAIEVAGGRSTGALQAALARFENGLKEAEASANAR